MTYASLKRDKDIRIHVRGHAGYNPGNDIVCAAISTITAMAGDFFLDQDRLYHRKNIKELVYKPGTFSLILKEDPEHKAEQDAALHMLVIGLCSIAEQYPQNLKVEGTL